MAVTYGTVLGYKQAHYVWVMDGGFCYAVLYTQSNLHCPLDSDILRLRLYLSAPDLPQLSQSLSACSLQHPDKVKALSSSFDLTSGIHPTTASGGNVLVLSHLPLDMTTHM